MNEDLLIQSAQSGDLDAFNTLILRYQNLLFSIALRILGDEDTAADALQEALISAFRKLNTFRGVHCAAGWRALSSMPATMSSGASGVSPRCLSNNWMPMEKRSSLITG
jgi:hypothetical protein